MAFFWGIYGERHGHQDKLVLISTERAVYTEKSRPEALAVWTERFGEVHNAKAEGRDFSVQTKHARLITSLLYSSFFINVLTNNNDPRILHFRSGRRRARHFPAQSGKQTTPKDRHFQYNSLEYFNAEKSRSSTLFDSRMEALHWITLGLCKCSTNSRDKNVGYQSSIFRRRSLDDSSAPPFCTILLDNVNWPVKPASWSLWKWYWNQKIMLLGLKPTSQSQERNCSPLLFLIATGPDANLWTDPKRRRPGKGWETSSADVRCWQICRIADPRFVCVR